jgi:4-amino-4-deoxy-L-arabinose transferase-like glycosyltransferase
MFRKNIIRTLKMILEKIFLLLCALGVLLPTSPINMPYTNRDSGVFLYIGWRILNGEIPYKDVWDHKPPVIYYINALGLALINNSRWGVWIIELISLSIAIYISYFMIKKFMGVYPAILSLIIWLSTLMIIQGGNLTTEYTLPFQFIALWLSYDIDKINVPRWRWLLLGVIGSISFLTKQTTIGIWLAIIIFVLITRINQKHFKIFYTELSIFSIGGLSILIVFILFLSSNQSIWQFIDEAFIYNIYYSSARNDLLSKLKPIFLGIAPLAKTGFLQLSMLGYLFGFILLIYQKELINKWKPILLVCLLDVPIELLLIGIPGRSYPHYYMTIIPSLTILLGLFFWLLFLMLSSWNVQEKATNIFLIGAMFVYLWSFLPQYRDQIWEFHKSEMLTSAIRYVNIRKLMNYSFLQNGLCTCTKMEICVINNYKLFVTKDRNVCVSRW